MAEKMPKMNPAIPNGMRNRAGGKIAAPMNPETKSRINDEMMILKALLPFLSVF